MVSNSAAVAPWPVLSGSLVVSQRLMQPLPRVVRPVSFGLGAFVPTQSGMLVGRLLMQRDGPRMSTMLSLSGPGQPPHRLGQLRHGRQRPARISSATAGTVREELRALRCNDSNTVASSMSWRTMSAPLACSTSTRVSKAALSWTASRPLTRAWPAAASRLATTPA